MLVVEAIPNSVLVEGSNLIAVEFHHFHDRTGFSDDLIFDLEILTRTNTGNLPPSVALTSPASPGLLRLPCNLTLQAVVTDDGPSLAYTVEFIGNGS